MLGLFKFLFLLVPVLSSSIRLGEKNDETLYNVSASSITRDQIMQRAQVWVDEKVPYSQSATTNGYRQDCSGYVSYCWASSTSGGGHWKYARNMY